MANTQNTGSIVITGKENIDRFRLMVLRSALRLEAQGMGRSRRPSALTSAREQGLTKARTAKEALADVSALLDN